MKALKVSEMRFGDLVGEVSFEPLYLPNGNFSGYYINKVGEKYVGPVSENFVVIKTGDVRNEIVNILQNNRLNIQHEKTLDFGTYHKHIMVLDKTFDFGENPFEGSLLDMNIPLNFSYLQDDLPDKDILGTCIEIYNSYCGLSKLFIVFKIIRFICANGVVIGDKISNIIIKHNTKEENIITKLDIELPRMVNKIEEIYLNYLPKFKKEISIGDALKILERAEKLGISKRYIKYIKETIMEEIKKKMDVIKLWWVWNFITYQIERNKTISNIATRQYSIYKGLMREIENI